LSTVWGCLRHFPPTLTKPEVPSFTGYNPLKNNIILGWCAYVQHSMRGHLVMTLEAEIRLCLWLRFCTRYGVVYSSGIYLSRDYIANTTTHQCNFTNNLEGFARWIYNYPNFPAGSLFQPFVRYVSSNYISETTELRYNYIQSQHQHHRWDMPPIEPRVTEVKSPSNRCLVRRWSSCENTSAGVIPRTRAISMSRSADPSSLDGVGCSIIFGVNYRQYHTSAGYTCVLLL